MQRRNAIGIAIGIVVVMAILIFTLVDRGLSNREYALDFNLDDRKLDTVVCDKAIYFSIEHENQTLNPNAEFLIYSNEEPKLIYKGKLKNIDKEKICLPESSEYGYFFMFILVDDDKVNKWGSDVHYHLNNNKRIEVELLYNSDKDETINFNIN